MKFTESDTKFQAEADYSTWLDGEFYEFAESWELAEFLETHREAEELALPWADPTDPDDDAIDELWSLASEGDDDADATE